MRTRLYSAIFMLAFGVAATGQNSPDQLPEGKGKDAVKRICIGCHEVATVTVTRRTKIGWRMNVEDMVSRGAEGSDEELQAIIDYLTQFYGKVNVNTASSRELQSLLGLSGDEAAAIVSYRGQIGKFKDFDQLSKTPGISVQKLQSKREQIAFSL
jgi:competence protein ComEA